jgi:flavodoxin
MTERVSRRAFLKMVGAAIGGLAICAVGGYSLLPFKVTVDNNTEVPDGTAIGDLNLKSLLVLMSYHHKNTEKIAKVFSRVLDAPIKTPHQINPEELQEYSLIGFGSGIYGAKHHEDLLDLADRLPKVTGKKAFIFSTSTFSWENEVSKNHSTLKEKLQSKGYLIVDEFNCPGFNTNSFIKNIGGLNKGRPSADDLKDAEEFAQNLKETQ